MTRIVYDPRTRLHIDRRMKEGLSKREAMRRRHPIDAPASFDVFRLFGRSCLAEI